MATKNIPAEITKFYLGLSDLGILSLLPSEWSEYKEYLNPERHSYDITRGKIDVGFTDRSLSFAVSELGFAYLIPEYGTLSASSANGTINGTLTLNGSYSDVQKKGKYTSLSLVGSIRGDASILGDKISFESNLDGDPIDVSLDARGNITIGDRVDVDLDSITATYRNSNLEVTSTASGRFRLNNNGGSISINSVTAIYSDRSNFWSANVSLSGDGKFVAEFFERSYLVGRLSSIGGTNIELEIGEELLNRFDISDASLSDLIQGQIVRLSDQEITDTTFSLNRNGFDLNPSVFFLMGGNSNAYSLENVISKTLDLNNLDIRLLSPEDSDAPPMHVFDIDGNRTTSIESDTLLILRKLFGTFPGSSLFDGIETYDLRDESEIGTFIDKLVTYNVLDLDDDGVISPLSDGTMLARYVSRIPAPQQSVSMSLESPYTLQNTLVNSAVVGTDNADRLTGTRAGDLLAGREGNDILTGKKGSDVFLLDIGGTENTLKITDFNAREGDVLAFLHNNNNATDQLSFKSVRSRSQLNDAKRLPKDIVYFESKGLLFYNQNQTDSGWGNGGKIAKLLGAPEFGKGDFVIV